MSTDKSIRAQAVSLWEELTGKSVNSSSYSFRVGGESFDLYQANKRVQQAQAVDDDLTVALVVKTLAEQFASAESFTLADILAGNERLKARMELVGRMNALFSADAAVTLFGTFYDYCEGALAHYRELKPQTLGEKSREFVRESGCFVGLDAYHGISRLTRLMICDGPVDEVAKAKVSRLVFAFDSIEELISHARRIPTGFSLCVILAPHISDSYFVMVVNTGGRIVALTDKGNYTHPMQEARMRARNDRYNLNRMEGSHFPYDLLDIEWGDNGRRASERQAGTALMVSDSGLRVLGKLSDLHDWDLLWLHLFIDQCRDRYFERKITEPQLATGSMVRLPHKWAESTEHLPVPIEYELKLDARTSADLNSQFLHTIEPEWAKSYNPNLWMEDRFATSVPDDCLYMPSTALNGETPILALGNDGNRELTRRNTENLPFWEKEKLPALNLQGMTATALSTPERVIRDCHFLARHNQAQVISQLVKEDYEKRKVAIQEWFYKAAAKYLPKLIDDLLALNHERVWVDTPAHQDALRALGNGNLVIGKGSGVQVITSFRSIKIRYEPVRKQHVGRRDRAGLSMATTLGLIDYTYGFYRCAVDRQDEAQLFIGLDVLSVFDVMTVTGLALEGIPAELRHMGVDTYTGNSILDRIDPLSHIRNPWDRLTLHYNLPVSLKAFKELRRRRGLLIPRATELEAYASQQAEGLLNSLRNASAPATIDGLE
ncbi:hypothetical protein [Pseudomonas sp. MWU12-2323]|uniref:hypothetical protein n=1 Tax=Pseudomonas sp. MWU12-2323 TaxID=2651296 RepID=UPI00128AF62F|nr:hypothetical protein [Pseudomonas sp. MWU12-2323]MPQ69473.1 hypothetical protein [Pseudomonas sp. MWU12-2323]